MEYLKVKVCTEQENKDLKTSYLCGQVVFVHINDIDGKIKHEDVKYILDFSVIFLN